MSNSGHQTRHGPPLTAPPFIKQQFTAPPLTALLATTLLLTTLIGGALGGCAPAPSAPTPPIGTEAPTKLSAWHLLAITQDNTQHNARGRHLQPLAGVIPYDLNIPLFTDYAHKLRTVWMPVGTSARIGPSGDLEWPVGTIFTKTFYYPLATLRHTDNAAPEAAKFLRSPQPTTVSDAASVTISTDGLPLDQVQLLETRILWHRKDGWTALPYVWNAEQTEAHLEIAGALQPATLVTTDGKTQPFTYVVPDRNQCAGCHAVDHSRRAITPIGPKLRHLDKPWTYASQNQPRQNQLNKLAAIGYLPKLQQTVRQPLPAWPETLPADPEAVAALARGYLDINCGHCHNPQGAADTSGLWLDAATGDPRRLGVCKPPVAAGRGAGGRHFSIIPGAADASILPWRMAATDPGIAMPELGRSLIHEEGVQLIRRWINQMPGSCGRNKENTTTDRTTPHPPTPTT